MTLQDYRSQISFRFIRPGTRLPRGYGEFAKMLRRLGLPFDVLNTRLPASPPHIPGAVRELSRMPRMSTVAISALINWAVAHMADDEMFVNVGVWHGFTFLSGVVSNPNKTAAGVDNFSKFGGPRQAFLERFNRYRSPRHSFHEMDYQEYFRQVHRGRIGFYIYDGDHSYEHQWRGLALAEPFFSPNCLVMIDDTNTREARQATLDFIAASRNRYRVLLDEPTTRNCHPTFWDGIMMLQKVG